MATDGVMMRRASHPPVTSAGAKAPHRHQFRVRFFLWSRRTIASLLL